MKNVLIVEHSTKGLQKLNETNITIPDSKKQYILGGIFTEFDVMNRNERIYTADKFLPHLTELIERKKNLGAIYGEFDHPDVFDTSLTRVSHTIESIQFSKEKNSIEGTIKLLSTHFGREAKALVDDDCPIFVSSRAAGVTESNGTVTIKKLFTYDAVADPGFSSARMEVKSLNESFGFNENANFRIYDISDESKINELFDMNKNDFVTKQQMVEYSNYLTEQIEETKKSIKGHLGSGKYDPKELLKLEEKYESLFEGFKKMTEYLDYMAENVQILVDKEKTLEKKTNKIIEHNDYLAENLEKSINFSDYLAENIDKGIEYTEYIAETLDKSIDFTEYIAENVDKNIKYSEYLAENLEKSIDYSQYVAENLDKTIDYSQYIAENLDKSIVYAEYVAENLDNNIKYSEYIAEHVDNNIKYSEYIAENVSDNIAYGNYLAESLDKLIDSKTGKLNESMGDDELDFSPDGDMSKYYNDDEDFEGDEEIDIDEEDDDDIQGQENIQIQGQAQGQIQGQVQDQIQGQEEFDDDDDIQGEELDDEGETGIAPGMVVKIDDDETGEVLAVNDENGIVVIKLSDSGEVQEIQESRVTPLGDGKLLENENSLQENIKRFIKESKKRKASEENEPHFLMFLTEKRKASWYNLSPEDKETVIYTINESNGYTSESDVLRLMEKALSKPEKTFEEKLVENLPTDLKPIWESLDNKNRQSIVNSASFYSNLSESNMESFWRSKGLEKYSKVEPGKKLLKETMIYDNQKLNEQQLEKYMNRLKNL